MKIGIASDLHLEFETIRLRNPGVDVLVLAGDICVAEDIKRFPFYEDREDTSSPRQRNSEKYQEFFEEVSREFPVVLVVMGNHEHYHGKFDSSEEILKKNLKLVGENIHLLQDDSLDVGDVRFIGSTLWTDLNAGCPLTEYHVQCGMSDYSVITKVVPYDPPTYRRLRPMDTVGSHVKSVQYLQNVLKESCDKKCVFVSHHAPSTLSIDPRYKSDVLMNGGYVSDLSNMILDNDNLKLCVHGHVHQKFDYLLGECRIVCNPRGYPGERDGLYLLKIVEV